MDSKEERLKAARERVINRYFLFINCQSESVLSNTCQAFAKNDLLIVVAYFYGKIIERQTTHN